MASNSFPHDPSTATPDWETVWEAFQVDPDAEISVLAQRAIFLARQLQLRARQLQTPQERRQQAELDRMIQNPHDKATLIQMTDQAFRSETAGRAADQLIHILDVQGVPRFFSPLERTLLRGFQSFGAYLPGVAVPLVKEKMQRETANVILPAERETLAKYLQQRKEEGVRMNVNFLGEALLGEQEAQRRLQGYLQALQWPEIEVISVKVSTLDSQITPLGKEASMGRLCDRLELLYRAALKVPHQQLDGSQVPKLIYLDMEEYRDMLITAEVFMRTLSRPGLEQASGGIALQAYLPDSHGVQQQILDWARRRLAAGGSPVTMRLVKGANMEMERVEAALHGWPQAPYSSKIETDANYKKMLHVALQAENIAAARLGVASHNLFDVCYALVVAAEEGCLENVQFEMLEGMANHQRRALRELVDNVLLYAPACQQNDFLNAIGYLVRRLDENTGPQNYLRHTFRLQVDSPVWKELEQQFLESLAKMDTVSNQPRRQQDRSQPLELMAADQTQEDWTCFENEPDTDFSLPANELWIRQQLQGWQQQASGSRHRPLVIAGNEVPDAECQVAWDPSCDGEQAGTYAVASEEDVTRAITCAREDPTGWRETTAVQRSELLRQVAHQLRVARGELITVALAEAGKTVAEADPEVSEAIDFVEFYRRCAVSYERMPEIDARGLGVVVVASPWNFPIAIPCGGIAAALASGNTVILKPASDTVLTAYRLCQCFWAGGVPPEALQLVPGSGATVGERLATDPDVDVVILTGGTETARHLLQQRPTINLLAETGGKNATIVTAMSDREQALKHVLHSAFSHGGQKCSATSLLILEQEVFEDEDFRETFKDAVESLAVGSAWELENRIGPLIRPPTGVMEAALKELESGESWLVMPHCLENNPRLYSPAVKWNLQPGSVTHMTEFFGPVLGVMSANNLAEAVLLANQTGYGLTAGLESLDEREQQYWSEHIRAGNLYINRPTTGAIVLRQPFGGYGKSAFGPGIKAGGPHYVRQLMQFLPLLSEEEGSTTQSIEGEPLKALAEAVEAADDQQLPRAEQRRLLTALASYDFWARQEFLQQHDHFGLPGQDNVRRYLPVDSLRIRICPNDSGFDIFARAAAAQSVGCRATISLAPGYPVELIRWLDELTEAWAGSIEFLEETDDQLLEAIVSDQVQRLRYRGADQVSLSIRKMVPDHGIYVADHPVLGQGRLELPWYVEEQSLSINYHRYGNLGERGARFSEKS
jgi:RHH-type proline utilization regulon transcriptional repressor/proline dehydrogenase/delta 1-pyrroline-5-carboxylate dehydrogenase